MTETADAKQQAKVVVGLTGASGALYAKLLLEKLATMPVKVGVVISAAATQVWQHELNLHPQNFLQSLLGINNITTYGTNDFSAPFASGSGGYQSMIIMPCSMGTLGRIAQGASADLLTRAADVVLKERGKLVLCVRESPYNLIHIKNMEAVTLAGGIICPASPGFYSLPTTLEQLAMGLVDRALHLIGLQPGGYSWGA